MKHKSKNEYYRGESGAGNLPHNQKEEKAPPPWGQMLSWSGPTENLNGRLDGWWSEGRSHKAWTVRPSMGASFYRTPSQGPEEGFCIEQFHRNY